MSIYSLLFVCVFCCCLHESIENDYYFDIDLFLEVCDILGISYNGRLYNFYKNGLYRDENKGIIHTVKSHLEVLEPVIPLSKPLALVVACFGLILKQTLTGDHTALMYQWADNGNINDLMEIYKHFNASSDFVFNDTGLRTAQNNFKRFIQHKRLADLEETCVNVKNEMAAFSDQLQEFVNNTDMEQPLAIVSGKLNITFFMAFCTGIQSETSDVRQMISQSDYWDSYVQIQDSLQNMFTNYNEEYVGDTFPNFNMINSSLVDDIYNAYEQEFEVDEDVENVFGPIVNHPAHRKSHPTIESKYIWIFGISFGILYCILVLTCAFVCEIFGWSIGSELNKLREHELQAKLQSTTPSNTKLVVKSS